MNKVLFLGCNYDQLPYLEEAKKIGFLVIGCDMNINAPGRQLCDHFINVGYDDAESIYKEILGIGFCTQDKIFTAAAQFAHKTAAEIANTIKINYPKSIHIQNILNKTEFYKDFQNIGVKIPETHLIFKEDELLNKIKKDRNYFLKSDFSKNPKYVYRIDKRFNFSSINWRKDRYFKKNYILQREFNGKNLRVNFADDHIFVFDFDTGNFDKNLTNSLREDIKEDVIKIVNFYGIKNWIVKFDIIIDESSNDYVFLDIGIDPPSRMLKAVNAKGHNFEKLYINKYLLNKKVSWNDFL
tara:strand:+ start:1939 stop:2829 length:891 start_codon:yes stop_codon:yes gene_type:complete